jgi:hypothetical protein
LHIRRSAVKNELHAADYGAVTIPAAGSHPTFSTAVVRRQPALRRDGRFTLAA